MADLGNQIRQSITLVIHGDKHCRVVTRVRVEGRDHGGLGLRSGGEGIGLRMECLAQEEEE